MMQQLGVLNVAAASAAASSLRKKVTIQLSLLWQLRY
jgi:hypothetical protein